MFLGVVNVGSTNVRREHSYVCNFIIVFMYDKMEKHCKYYVYVFIVSGKEIFCKYCVCLFDGV